jgi:hypothetical protein
VAVTAEGPQNIGQCTIAVDDADGDLPADSHVTIMVTIDTHKHALAIPREALHTEGAEAATCTVWWTAKWKRLRYRSDSPISPLLKSPLD